MKFRKAMISVLLPAAMCMSTLFAGTAWAGSDKSFSIDKANWTEQDWNCIAMASAEVETGVAIRRAPDKDSPAVGFLYPGSAVMYVNKGTEWSEVKSVDVHGYIKNEFLVGGDEAQAIIDENCVPGVMVRWDGVNLFTAEDPNAEIIGTLEAGMKLTVLSDEGHWLNVQYGADMSGFVSEEDVSRIVLVDAAVPVDGMEQAGYGEYPVDGTPFEYAEAAAADTDAGESDSAETVDESEDTYTETASDTGDDSQTWTPETSAPAETWTPETSAPAETWTPETTAQTEAWTPETAAQTEAWVPETTAQTEAWVPETTAQTEAPAPETSAQTEAAADDYEAYTPETTAETSAAETVVAADTSSGSSNAGGDYSNYSDRDLLAAIIYTEAGNQSQEGQVAVGSVVMNRVASGSFPDTVSEVLNQEGQFYPASSGTLQSALENGVPDSAYAAADAAMTGEKPVGDALYFNTSSGTTKLGDHYFS